MMNAWPAGAWVCWVSSAMFWAPTRTVVSPVVPPPVWGDPPGFGEPGAADTAGAPDAPGPPDGLGLRAPPAARPADAAADPPADAEAPAPGLPTAGSVTDGSGANVHPEPLALV